MHRSLMLAALLWTPGDAAGWELKPDPPAEKPWAVKADLAVPLSGRTARITFAEANGPFVLVAPGEVTAREVYDLRTGARTARFDCGEKRSAATRETLSPDGLVWLSAKPFGTEVRVLDTAGGHVLPAPKVDVAVQAVGFAGGGRVVVIGTKGRDRTAQVFKSAAEEVGKWRLDAGRIAPPGPTPGFAVSPGGKYLAAVGTKTVAVHALPDGKKVADLDLPAEPGAPGRLPPPVGVAFSADGGELAVVVGRDDKTVGTLAVWNLADGRQTLSGIERPQATAGLDAAALTPVLSGGWLIDGTQVWAGGKVQRSVPWGPLLPSARLAVTPGQVVGVAEVKGMRNVAVCVIAESDTASNPAKDGSLDGARDVTDNGQAGWPGAVGGFTPAFDPAPLRLDLNTKRAVGLTAPLDGRLWLAEADFGPAPETARRTVHAHDARTGAAVTTFDLPPKRLLFGEAATSDAVLTIGAPDANGGAERLELVATDGRPVGGWRPHAGVKPDPFRSSIVYAAALGRARAVTVGNGRVTVWQLPEAKAVWTARMAEAAGGKLSPDGKVLFVPHAGGVRAFDLETGSTLGNLKGDPLTLRPGQDALAAAVSGDGRRLAVFGGAPLGREARVWDLTTGDQVAALKAVTFDANPPLRFFGPRFLLVGESVYDTTTSQEVWRAKPGFNGVSAAAAPADGRLWYATPVGSRWAVLPAQFPADTLADFLAAFAKHGKPILRPDEPVALAVEPPADAPPEWEAQARAAARLGLRAAKLTESDDAPTVVRIRYARLPGGAPVKFKWQGVENLGREETVTRFGVESQAEITRDGRSVWRGPPMRHEMRIKEWPQVNVITDDSKGGQEFFSRQVWAEAATAAGFPFATLGQSSAVVDGQTWKVPLAAVLTADGITTEWPPGFTPQPPPAAVEGDLPADPRQQPGVPGPAVLIASGCGIMLLLAVGALAVGVMVARGKNAASAERRATAAGFRERPPTKEEFLTVPPVRETPRMRQSDFGPGTTRPTK